MASLTSTDLTSPGWALALSLLRQDTNPALRAMEFGAYPGAPKLRDGLALLVVNTNTERGWVLSKVDRKTHPAVLALSPDNFRQFAAVLHKVAVDAKRFVPAAEAKS